jgi:uncharacterized protein
MEALFYTTIYVLLIYAGVCAVFYFLQERFIFVDFFPGRVNTEVARPTEEFFFDTPENGRIHGLLIKAKDSKGLIFYLHGNTGNIQRWKFMAEELVTFGWDVFVPDFRGYGLSTGVRSEAAMHADMLSVYDQISERLRPGRLIVYGRSLGSGFAVPLAAKRPCEHVILETPFLSMVHVAGMRFPFLPIRLLLRFDFRSDKHITSVSVPILIFHGTMDIIVPYRSAFRLYEKVRHRSDCELITLVNGRHNNLNTFPLFREKLGEVLA